GRVLVGVVGLRQPPDVVVAVEGTGAVAAADADLQVQRLVLGVPHLVQPLLAEVRLSVQCGRCGGAQRPFGGEEDRVAERGGVGELQVVAGVEPPAQHVDRAADLLQRGVGDDVAVRFEVGRGVHGRLGVVEVRGLAAGLAGDHVRPVPLHLVERHTVGDRLAVQGRGVGDAEVRRAAGGAAADLDVVRAGGVQAGEGDRVHRLVLGVPRTPAGAVHLAGQHRVPGRVDDVEGDVAD